jgi:hypothetical protein
VAECYLHSVRSVTPNTTATQGASSQSSAWEFSPSERTDEVRCLCFAGRVGACDPGKTPGPSVTIYRFDLGAMAPLEIQRVAAAPLGYGCERFVCCGECD